MPPKNNLVIVESGAKARTIEKYLTDLKNHGRFRVVASLGHVVDLPPKEMGIDFDTWSMKYVPIAEKRSVLQKIQKMVQESDMVYLAADPDREGEAIAKNLYDVLGLTPERTRRAVFHEITPQAITQAILNPRGIDMALVDAQETRRILDRMVGYKLSPLLWRRFSGYNLSAGRVQTAALRMVVERAKEVDDFRPEPIWEIHGTFHVPSPIETTLEGGPMHDRKQVEALMKELARNGGTAAWTASFKTRRVKKSPSPPFTTTCLQQEAHSRYGFGAKTTMQLAQALYEGGQDRQRRRSWRTKGTLWRRDGP
jgi:DNA topoisomerase-1